MSLSKEQFIKNSVWTFLELALYPVLMIVATPVFINKLGIEQYGLWMLITTITQGINVLNIGVGDTNIRLISKYRAESNFSLIKKVFHYNFSLSLFLFFAALLIGSVFYYFNFISVFYKTNDYSFANNILMLACASAGIKFIEIAIISLFKAFERFDISSKLTLMSKNSVMLVNLALVLFGHGLVTVFIFTISLNFLNVCAQFIVLYKYDNKIMSWPSFIFFKEKLDYLNYNFWYWLQSVIALLGFLADKFVVAYFTDVKTLGYYSIASLIGIQIHNFFLSFGGFIFPRVSFKMAQKTSVLPVYYVTRCFVAIAGWTIICFLILFGDFIFEWWLGSETFTHSIYFIQLYLVFEAAALLVIVPFHFINGTVFIKLNSIFEIVIKSSQFIAMLIGFYMQGINGVLYGLIVAMFFNIPFQYYYFHKKIVQVKEQNFLWVILPVFFMLGIIFFNNVFFKVSLVAGLIISTKIIYFDTAKQYASLSSLFGRKTD